MRYYIINGGLIMDRPTMEDYLTKYIIQHKRFDVLYGKNLLNVKYRPFNIGKALFGRHNVKTFEVH